MYISIDLAHSIASPIPSRWQEKTSSSLLTKACISGIFLLEWKINPSNKQHLLCLSLWTDLSFVHFLLALIICKLNFRRSTFYFCTCFLFFFSVGHLISISYSVHFFFPVHFFFSFLSYPLHPCNEDSRHNSAKSSSNLSSRVRPHTARYGSFTSMVYHMPVIDLSQARIGPSLSDPSPILESGLTFTCLSFPSLLSSKPSLPRRETSTTGNPCLNPTQGPLRAASN